MISDSADLVRLDSTHTALAVEVLSAAFFNYPVSVFSYPDEEMRKMKLPYFFEFVFRYCLKYGEAYAPSQSIEGVAMWLSSKYFPINMWRMLRSVSFSILKAMSGDNYRKMQAFGKYIDDIHRRAVPEKHMYLQTLGVAPEHQGKGFAGRLLKPMFARLDREGLPCFLETLDVKDVPFYEHFGFQTVDESVVPNTQHTNWAMLRNPRDFNVSGEDS